MTETTLKLAMCAKQYICVENKECTKCPIKSICNKPYSDISFEEMENASRYIIKRLKERGVISE